MFNQRFLLLFATELIARTGYQIGKSPVLPVMALYLGAGDALLGFIVAVSTCTGLVLKPVIGYLADRYGRYRFLLLAIAFLILPCFAYPMATSPADLVGLRVVHGITTAILGPTLLGMLYSPGGARAAELFGWFGLARQGSYVLGPLLGGMLLAILAPADIYLVVGAISLLALLPVLMLRNLQGPSTNRTSQPVTQVSSFWVNARYMAAKPAVLTAGLFELSTYMSLYFYKAFLPVLALRSGVQILEIGVFLAIQELVGVILRPITGNLADRIGHKVILAVGLVCVGMVCVTIPLFLEASQFISLAVALGASQAIVQPALQALISVSDPRHRSLAFGLAGAFRNAGKVLGPIVGGVLMIWMQPAATFLAIGSLTLVLGLCIIAYKLQLFSASRLQKFTLLSIPAKVSRLESLDKP